MIRINSNMKTTFQYLLFLLFMCGVFGVEVKRVSVMEGESVTLNPGLTEIQTYRRILWRFGTDLSTIAWITGGMITYNDDVDIRFRDRLQLDNKTASLTITNMRMKYSGSYKLEVISIETKYSEFIVDVYESRSAIDVGKVELKSMSEMKGNPVTLQTGVPQLHGDELIVWRFGDEGKLLAKCDEETKISTLYDDADGRFRDRLQLNNQTGSLTITNTRTTDSGPYTVKVSSSKQMLYKIFTVTVSEPGHWGAKKWIAAFAAAAAAAGGAVLLFVIHIRNKLKKERSLIIPETVKCMEGDFAFLSSGVTEIREGDQMLWTSEDKESLIATMSKKDKTTYYYAKSFRGRLQLDPQTGSLTIRNLRKTDSGLYQLKIKSRGGASYRKYKVTLCGDVKTVRVKEGEDVILKFDHFTVRSVFRIKWFRDERCIAALATENNRISTPKIPDGRFEGRLQLNEKTGFLTIKKIRPEHTGVYEVRSNLSAHGSRIFSIVFDDSSETWNNESETAGLMGRILRCPVLDRKTGVFRETDEMKTVSIKEGDSLDLNTRTKIQADDEILLMFGTIFATKHPYYIIARLNKQGIDEFKSAEKKFKDKIKPQLEDPTGFLTITITDTTITRCGYYYVQITNKTNKSLKTFTFIVTLEGVFNDVVKSVSVKEKKSVTLPADDTEVDKDELILWTFGPQHMIISYNKDTRYNYGKFEDRLILDKTTGSLTIKEIKITDTGVYQLQVMSSIRTKIKRFNVTVQSDSVAVPTPSDDETASESTALRFWNEVLDGQEATSAL